MPKVAKQVRQAQAEAQNWRCAYCSVVLSCSGADCATVDHVVPRAAGGRDHRSNLVCACAACNLARGADIDVWAFWKIRSRLLRDGLWPPGETPGAEIRGFLSAHRAYTRAKLALRRAAAAARAPATDLLIRDLAEALNEGCTLTALQITRLQARRRRCGYIMPATSRLGAANAEREVWDCLWGGALDDMTLPGPVQP